MIEVTDVVRSFGDTRVLTGLTFAAHTGEITGFLGPNGAGKTTTMRILATLLKPEGGRVFVAGYDAQRQPHEVRGSIGLVTEEPSLLDRFTVREQLAFAAKAHGFDTTATERRIAALHDTIGIGPLLDTRAGALSKGNRQKASLARALVHDPPVLLLDEPTANLDVVAQAGLQELLLDHTVRSGKTVLLSTHVIDEAERLCDRVVALAGGKAVAVGTPRQLVDAGAGGTFRDAILSMFATPTGTT